MASNLRLIRLSIATLARKQNVVFKVNVLVQQMSEDERAIF